MKLAFVLSVCLGLLLHSGATIPDERATEASCMMEPLEDYQHKLEFGPHFIGRYRGKEFVTAHQPLSWLESIAYCYSKGLFPGTIEDIGDFDLLVSKTSEMGTGYDWLWTSGVDVTARRSFSWYHTRVALNMSGGFPVNVNNTDTKSRCLALRKTKTGKSLLINWSCEQQMYPICEDRASTCDQQ